MSLPGQNGNRSDYFQREFIERKNGRVAILTMSLLPPNNTLNYEIILELREQMLQLCRESDLIIVRSANPLYFSNGIDGRYLASLNKKGQKKYSPSLFVVLGC